MTRDVEDFSITPFAMASGGGMKPDYVICVGGTPGFGWLTLPSDEQNPMDLIVTTDLEMVVRYAGYADAKPTFDALVKAHPKRQFSMMTLAPLGCEPMTFETPEVCVTMARPAPKDKK